MKRVIYPGSFDPFTNGHLDLVRRGAGLFSEVIVAVAVNPDKHPLFSLEERKDLIRACCRDIERVRVVHFQGLLVEAVRFYQVDAVLRGIRAFSDFEYELQMAFMNRSLCPEFETVFLMPRVENSFVSSRGVKEVAMLGGDYGSYVPEPVRAAIREKLVQGEYR